MVRTAVKTLTLNVYAIPLPAVQQFVTSPPAAAYFAELAAHVAEQCRVRRRVRWRRRPVQRRCKRAPPVC